MGLGEVHKYPKKCIRTIKRDFVLSKEFFEVAREMIRCLPLMTAANATTSWKWYGEKITDIHRYQPSPKKLKVVSVTKGYFENSICWLRVGGYMVIITSLS